MTVEPLTPLKEVARLLVERRVSGVPVVDDDGTVVGVVSEGDILVKERDRQSPASLLGHLLEWDEGNRLRREARDAADAMTGPAVTIRPSRSVSEAASLMLDRSVNRLPVVDQHGKLVGIVTRADLVRAFARSDEEIEREIREDVIVRSLDEVRSLRRRCRRGGSHDRRRDDGCGVGGHADPSRRARPRRGERPIPYHLADLSDDRLNGPGDRCGAVSRPARR